MKLLITRPRVKQRKKNMSFARIPTFVWGLLAFLGSPSLSSAETIRLYFDPAIPQIAFAAGDIKTALEKQLHTVETQNLSALANDDSAKKIVLCRWLVVKLGQEGDPACLGHDLMKHGLWHLAHCQRSPNSS